MDLLHEEDPTLPQEVINKDEKILVRSSGGYQERSTNIKVNPFKECMCFVVPIMESGFFVLPQGTPFACVMML